MEYDQKTVSICGIISASKMLTTKAGKQMMFATLEDMYGSVELVIFPKVFAKFSYLLREDTVVKVTGKVNIKENEKTKILVSFIDEINNNKVDMLNKNNNNLNKKEEKIYIRIPNGKEEMEQVVLDILKSIAEDNNGSTKVCLFYEGNKKIKLLNQKYFLNITDNVLHELKTSFGENNVKIK